MVNNLNAVIEKIGEEFSDLIQEDGRNYLEVSLSRKAGELGLTDIEQCYDNVFAIVPIKHPVDGMKVRIDGRTFVNYQQFDSGVVVPGYVAEYTDLPHRPYAVQNSMICNFT